MKPGRHKIIIDFKELERLCHIQCTEEEIAEWFHCSVDTIERRIKEKTNGSFAEFFAKHRTQGKIALRRNLFRLSEKHPSMAIFLAKNWLGMKDTQELVGAGGGPVNVHITVSSKEDKDNVEEVMKGART